MPKPFFENKSSGGKKNIFYVKVFLYEPNTSDHVIKADKKILLYVHLKTIKTEDLYSVTYLTSFLRRGLI